MLRSRLRGSALPLEPGLPLLQPGDGLLPLAGGQLPGQGSVDVQDVVQKRGVDAAGGRTDGLLLGSGMGGKGIKWGK